MSPPDAITFGPFRLQPAQQLLLEGERRLEIGSRALEILIALVERPGDLVTKEELVARAWPDTVVDESNLRAQVAALRRVLRDGRRGARYLVTVPGRGYRFVAPVANAAPKPPRTTTAVPLHNLPARLTRMIGRADVVSAVAGRLQRRRFITIVGAGGIGKTTVALAVAEAVASSYQDGVAFVDLAPLTDERLVSSALASALGLAIVSEDPTGAVIAFLRQRRMLVVFDSCEHVVEAAALLAERVLKGASHVHVLATSREPLRADGESVQRIGPLDVPPPSETLTATEAAAYSAVELFVARASACVAGFELTDADAPIVAEICRRLDGIALAIELVAGRVDAFGVRGIAARLDDRLRLLTHGRRTALPRHQTLIAALDWSYEFLSEPERVVLRRLAVFAGCFNLAAANEVAAEGAVAPPDVPDLVADLVAKSLVSVEGGRDTGLYRLLDTTRAYALAKLTEAGELHCVSSRHAEQFRALLVRPQSEWEGEPTGGWRERGHWIGNVRAALDWALGAGGDVDLGISLTLASVPLWVHLSMMQECRRHVERALARLEFPQERASRRVMQLLAALGAALQQTRGSAAQTEAVWARALEIAERLDDTDYRLRALSGIWLGQINGKDLPAALATAERFRTLAERSSQPIDPAVGERMVGGALFVMGELARARAHTENMLRANASDVRRSLIARFAFDQRILAANTLAGILWLQGFSDQATATAGAALDEALATGHVLTVCNVLADSACPIAMLSGDLAEAERLGELLVERAASHALEVFSTWGRCFHALIRAKRSDSPDRVQILLGALDGLGPPPRHPRYMTVLAEIVESLGRAGEAAKGLGALDEALASSEATGELFAVAELLRVKGEMILLQGGAHAPRLAAKHFAQSLDWARRQGALAWELRTATSLARLRQNGARGCDARAELESTFARLSEGFGTADAREARALLDELA